MQCSQTAGQKGTLNLPHVDNFSCVHQRMLTAATTLDISGLPVKLHITVLCNQHRLSVSPPSLPLPLPLPISQLCIPLNWFNPLGDLLPHSDPQKLPARNCSCTWQSQ